MIIQSLRHISENVQGSEVTHDYYPFGLTMRLYGDPNYRYSYQGNFSERDEETKFQHFELRDYDGVIICFSSTLFWIFRRMKQSYNQNVIYMALKVDAEGGFFEKNTRVLPYRT